MPFFQWTHDARDGGFDSYVGHTPAGGPPYTAYLSRWCANITFGGFPAKGAGWAYLTIVLADTEYLTPARWFRSEGFRRESWDDYYGDMTTWCESLLHRYVTQGHTAADITHIYYNYPRGIPTSYWEPLPWACISHRRQGAGAGYTPMQLRHEDEVACAACQAGYATLLQRHGGLLA